APPLAVPSEQRFPEWLGWGEFVRGWALAEDGDVAVGTADMERGYAAIVRTGSTFNTSARASLAAAYVKEGRAAEALAIVDEECAALEETGARAFEAELHRIAGEALARCAGRSTAADARLRRARGVRRALGGTALPPPAAARLRRALEVSRRRGGLALKLRAATSLARFWADTGDASGARDVLA